MKLIKTSLIAAGVVSAVAALSACSSYDDGYHRSYSSVSVGVSSAPGYRGDRDGDGVPNRYDRDRDGDGVPNRFDSRPNNPYRP
jgi:hypothetical protein